MNNTYIVDKMNNAMAAMLEDLCNANHRIKMLEKRINALQIAGHTVVAIAKLSCDRGDYDDTQLNQFRDIFNEKTI